MKDGVPMDARVKIDAMFLHLQNGEIDPSTLHGELEAWQMSDQIRTKYQLKGVLPIDTVNG